MGTPFDRDDFLQWIAADGNFAIFDDGVGKENATIYKDWPRVILSCCPRPAQATRSKRASGLVCRWSPLYRHT
jgi:hypothetical protein